jgi:zinc transporter ZupT
MTVPDARFLIISSVLIFVVSVLGILLAGRFKPSTILIYAQTFASGAFIGFSVLHFIPETVACFNRLRRDEEHSLDYPVYSAVFVAVFLFFLLAELAAAIRTNRADESRQEISSDAPKDFSPFLMRHFSALPSHFLKGIMSIFLIVHAVIIGFAIFFQRKAHLDLTTGLLVNTSVQKFIEAFGIALLLRRHAPNLVFWVLMGVYSIATPLTVVGVGWADFQPSDLFIGSCLSISAGLFLFIGILLWRRTFLTPFDWKKVELVVLSSIFLVSIVIQALTCITTHV